VAWGLLGLQQLWICRLDFVHNKMLRQAVLVGGLRERLREIQKEEYETFIESFEKQFGMGGNGLPAGVCTGYGLCLGWRRDN
jgi:hypothetical protein